jgi:ubiquinone/menaquinone biosynthesis C-methylase UbiE
MSDPDDRIEAPDARSRAYYDAFAARYDRERGGAVAGGYHDLVDDLEVGFVRRFATGKDVLEVGCGTGLLLARISKFARSAQGVDLSPGMLERAHARGQRAQLGSATALPHADASFDVACAFKVLAHVPRIADALSEMARVVRPGGYILAEFYNPWSLRGAIKRLTPARSVALGVREDAVFTRYDSPRDVRALVPANCRVVARRGVRIFTPAAALFGVPGLRQTLSWLESRACDSALAHFAGFWIVALRKEG